MIELKIICPHDSQSGEPEIYVQDSMWREAVRLPVETYEALVTICDKLITAADEIGAQADSTTLVQSYLNAAKNKVLDAAAFLAGTTPTAMTYRTPGSSMVREVFSVKPRIDSKITNRINIINNKRF